MRRLEPIVRAALAGACRLPAGSTVLAAVSGGADSTALLLALRRVTPEFGLGLHAAHLDHGLRGAESRADRAFVIDLCARLGVPLASARWNARLRMRRSGLSGEAGLRTLRRSYLEAVAIRIEAAAIATGHTADDQLETVLMRLLRGTGARGLGGMRPRTGRWIKPLLDATREDVESDLRRAGQGWREDSSNRDPVYTRNRIRHEVVPALLRSLSGDPEEPRSHALLVRRVARAAAEVRDAQRAIDRAASRLLDGGGRCGKRGWTIATEAFAGRSKAVARAVLRRCWSRLAGGHTGLTHRHLEQLERLAAGPPGASVRLPGGIVARRERGALTIGRPAPSAEPRSFQVDVPGEVSCGLRTVRSTWTTPAVAHGGWKGKSSAEEFFAAEGLEGVLELRVARADEWFVPFGRRRRVRIAEFLTKQRVTREFRSRPTVLADAGGILWVIGVRRSARAPVTSGTRRVLRVFAENHD